MLVRLVKNNSRKHNSVVLTSDGLAEWSCAVGLNKVKCLIFLRLTQSSTQIIQQKTQINEYENCGYDIMQLSGAHPTVQNEHNPLMLRQEKCEFVVQKVPFYTKNLNIIFLQ